MQASRINKQPHRRGNSKASNHAASKTTDSKPAPITAFIQGDYKTTLQSVRPNQEKEKQQKQQNGRQRNDFKNKDKQQQEQQLSQQQQQEDETTNRVMQPHLLFALNVKASQQNFEISNQIVDMICSSSSIINGKVEKEIKKVSNKKQPVETLSIQQQELLQYTDLINEFLDSSVVDSLEFPQLEDIITLLKQQQLQEDAKSSRLHKNDEGNQSDDIQFFAAPMSYLNPVGGSKYAAHQPKEGNAATADVILNKEISQRILSIRREYPQFKEMFEKRIKDLTVDLFVKLQILNQATALGQTKRFQSGWKVNPRTGNLKMQSFISGMNDLICSQIQEIHPPQEE